MFIDVSVEKVLDNFKEFVKAGGVVTPALLELCIVRADLAWMLGMPRHKQ